MQLNPYQPGETVRAWHRKKTGEISLKEIRNAIYDEPTQLVKSIRPARTPMALSLYGLSLDALARPCLCIHEPTVGTFELVQAAVALFKQKRGAWPVVILLSRDRWVMVGERLQRYTPVAGVSIPFGYEGGSYDLLVRGQRIDIRQ